MKSHTLDVIEAQQQTLLAHQKTQGLQLDLLAQAATVLTNAVNELLRQTTALAQTVVQLEVDVGALGALPQLLTAVAATVSSLGERLTAVEAGVKELLKRGEVTGVVATPGEPIVRP